MYIQPLTEGQYFHIYNRGVNREDLFKDLCNYNYFLQQYKMYCSDVLETFAYALLKNHFHFLVYVKEDVKVIKHNGQGTIQLNASKQLSHFFNSYAQSINKSFKRTGPLFETPFERRLIEDNSYFTSMVRYCHHNPELHGFVKDFKEYDFTSYHAILKNNNDLLASKMVMEWFGGTTAFQSAHENRNTSDDTLPFVLE